MADPDSLDNIHISVLAQGEVPHTLPHKPAGDIPAPTPCESQTQGHTTTTTTITTATATTTPTAASVSPAPSLAGPTASAPARDDPRKSTRLWKQREGKEKHRELGGKFCIDQDLAKKQRKEEFCSKVDRWTQKLSLSSNIVEVRHLLGMF